VNFIKKSFDRPHKDLIFAFGKLAVTAISDAMGRIGAMNSSIKSICRGINMVGPAYTVLNHPKDNLMSHYALKYAKPGDVLIISTGEYREFSGWGELMTLAAKVKGLSGVIVDGGVRDAKQISEMGYPVFSSCVIPEGTFKLNPGSINATVICGGIMVNPGDIIVGDDDGVVVVPANISEDILSKSQAIVTKEKALKERILSGESIYDILDLQTILDSHDWIIA